MSDVKLTNFSMGYDRRLLFDDVCLDVPAGRLTALIGPNGSGKSSLLRAMCGLQAASSGSVQLKGREVSTYRASDLAKVRAFMPQHTITPEAMTAKQLVGCGRYAYQGLFGAVSREDKEAIDWAMEVCGVAIFKSKQLQDLSGGERQRVWLASALAQKAPILMLDEPCSYLDISYQIDLMELLRDLVDSEQLTVILSSHDLNHAAQFADNLIALKSGRVQSTGDVADALTGDLVRDLFNVRTEFQTSAVSGKSFCMFHAV
ncbi:ferrichrome transport ATP-binding protein FhuC [Roseibium sp. TrichSKD4]|uniref:ABC transporter ATP-binding protein n=1 Tax=Roseibium sp. TrichSKD4 TaxID=744980 RepID=UPI0001E56CB1|nr:ABC transporter ATP-binding protein [Roseibium sp. TrichSKD4]EFO32695.1 ferrichrome transport ATP-binding protein FhuC [Roseibium sp. TrichSKD4]